MTDISSQSSAVDAAYQSGRRVGLATAAVALGFVSFLNLLGMEKSILALVLAILAMHARSLTALRVPPKSACASAADVSRAASDSGRARAVSLM